MKMWIEHWDVQFYKVHAFEPEFVDVGLRWYSPAWLEACREYLMRVGFEPLPHGDELNEYDLSGEKPRYLCTWRPR